MIEFAYEAIWSWTSVCWKFLNHSFNFSACDLSVLSFLFLPGSVLEDCTLLRICPIILVWPLYWHHLLIVVSFDHLYLHDAHCIVSFFISIFIDLSPFLFFSISLAKGLSILLIFSKYQLLILLIFSTFFTFPSFISFLIFMISFLLLTLGFVCSFFLLH